MNTCVAVAVPRAHSSRWTRRVSTSSGPRTATTVTSTYKVKNEENAEHTTTKRGLRNEDADGGGGGDDDDDDDSDDHDNADDDDDDGDYDAREA